MIRRLILLFFVLAVLAGALGLVLAAVASTRHDPDEVRWGADSFAVRRREVGEVVGFEFVRSKDGVVAASLGGTTDLLCDRPQLVLVDVDDDDELEVYFSTCDEGGFIDYRGAGSLAVVELSEQQEASLEAIHTLWFHEIRHGPWFLLPWGALLFLAGLAGLGVMGLVSRLGKRRPSRGPAS